MPDRYGNETYNCDLCWEGRPDSFRRDVHCGYIDEGDWSAACSLPARLANSGVSPREVGVCPGWLRRQPAVEDALEAYNLLRHNRIPDEQVLYEAAVLAESAFSLWEAWQADENERKRQHSADAKK